MLTRLLALARRLVCGRSDREVERLRVLIFREAKAQQEHGQMAETWRLIDLIFLDRQPPPTEEERAELGSIGDTRYVEPPPGPPLA